MKEYAAARPQGDSGRDTRIDVFRALALLTIFITHIPGNIFDRFTLKNFGFADAAEVFVLISGIAVGIAYAGKMQGPKQAKVALTIWRRAWTLVRAHLATTMATLFIFCGMAVLYGRPDILLQNNILPVIDDTERAVIGLATLGHQLGYNNILPMYAVLLLATPAILWGLKRNAILTVGISAAVWLAAGVWQIAPPNYPTKGFWFLNPLSWQFLYTIAIAATMHVRSGGRLPQDIFFTRLAVAYLVFALVWINGPLWGVPIWFGLPPVLGGFDKTFLSVSRLLNVLALAYLVARWPVVSNLARTAPTNPLAILGRHSLHVFVAGTISAMAAQAIRAVYIPTLTLDLSLLAIGLMVQLFVAYTLEARRRSQGDAAVRTSRAVSATSPVSSGSPAEAFVLANSAGRPAARD